MKTEAIIFDLDGTLLDSLAGIAEAMNRLLRRLGAPVHGEEAYRYFVGDGVEEMVLRTLPEADREAAPLDALVAEYREYYQAAWPNLSPPYRGIPELLTALARRGIKMAVLSNKSDDFTRKMVSELLTGSYFTVIRGVTPGGVRKPDPAPALELAQLMGTAPEHVMFVGDTRIDMETACAAGMNPVGVLWGFRTRDELIRSGARFLIQHPLELLELIH